jgi:hypothetical protein
MQRDRVTAPFTIFFRTISGEGGYGCETCRSHRHDSFRRMSDVFAVAAHHLNLCRAAMRGRPVEGAAIIDGTKYGVVLRDGVMLVAMQPAFGSCQPAVRLIAS